MSRRVSPAFNINSPIPGQWEDYVTQLPAGLEIVPKHHWDEENYVGNGAGTGTRQLDFFVNIQGKNLNQTSMKQPRQLPNPEAMLIQNIRVKFKQPVQSDNSGAGDATPLVSSFNDLVQLADFGVMQITIGEKNYGPFLPWTLPANSFVKGAFSTGSDLLASYGQIDGVLYPLFPNLMIAPLQQFSVTLTWPGGAITLSTDTEEVASELPIVVLLDGQGSRAIQ